MESVVGTRKHFYMLLSDVRDTQTSYSVCPRIFTSIRSVSPHTFPPTVVPPCLLSPPTHFLHRFCLHVSCLPSSTSSTVIHPRASCSSHAAVAPAQSPPTQTYKFASLPSPEPTLPPCTSHATQHSGPRGILSRLVPLLVWLHRNEV